MPTSPQQLGLWLIGAAGNVAATVAVGLAALRRRRVPPIGLFTEQPACRRLRLAPLSGILLGGHEISRRRVTETAAELHEQGGVFDPALLGTVRSELAAFQRDIRAGTSIRCGSAIGGLASRPAWDRRLSARRIIDRLRRDLRSFARRRNLRRVVVVHLASTEPRFDLGPVHQRWTLLETALRRRASSPLPASSLYAIAAIEESMPFVNFTPSLGADLPAVCELAELRGVPIAGADGKTGETLLKTVVAPMFRHRGLEVLSWVGHNILGNRDGQVLAAPRNKAAKLYTKQGVLAALLGYRPETHTSIEYVRSLHDWKTAWDHIHFRGFLGTKMSLQFTWRGCDSILAAPLVIDLARLADLHARIGGAGVMTHLACFFKSPMDCPVQDFSEQMRMLERYLADVAPPERRP